MITYRTRNEFLMYAVNRRILVKESQLWQSLDEMTSMKILSRIEGDKDRTEKPLEGLKKLVKEQKVPVPHSPAAENSRTVRSCPRGCSTLGQQYPTGSPPPMPSRWPTTLTTG